MAESGPRAGLQVLQNSGSRMFMLRVKTLSVRDRHWRNPRKKNYRERSNIKSARVSARTGSVPRKMAVTWQKKLAPCWNRTHATKLSTTSLNHQAIGSYQLPENNGIWIVILFELFCIAFLDAELSISDSSGWISRLGKRYQYTWTQTYDWLILSHST